MSTPDLLSHLARGGILARLVDGQLQYLTLENDHPHVYGYGSANAGPLSVYASVKESPDKWVMIERGTPGNKLAQAAREKGLIEGME